MEEELKKVVQVFNFRLADPFDWLKLFEEKVQIFCKTEAYLDSDYFYYFSSLLEPDDEIWFHSEKKNDHIWKDFKKLFIDYFREKKRVCLDEVLHEKYQTGDLFDFCKQKLSDLALHFPYFNEKDKIQIVVSCLGADHYKEFCSSFDLSIERFLRVVQGFCVKNKSSAPASSLSTNPQAELKNYIEQALTSKTVLKFIKKHITKCNQAQNEEVDSNQESESDDLEIDEAGTAKESNKRKNQSTPKDNRDKRQKTA